MIKQQCENHLHEKKKNNTTQHSKHPVKKKKKCGLCEETWKNNYLCITDGSQWPNFERDKWPLVTNNRLSVIIIY